MTATTFNPLAVARDLKAAGIEAEHAEGMRRAADAAASAGRDELATEPDLYRALRIQGAGIVAIIGGFIAIAASLKLL